MSKNQRSLFKHIYMSLLQKVINKIFSYFLPRALKGEVAENQASFRVRGDPDFQFLLYILLFGVHSFFKPLTLKLIINTAFILESFIKVKTP